jgi:hypothetical protein
MTNYGASTDSSRGNNSCSSSTENLSPGIYSSITVNCQNTTLAFASGLYVLESNGGVALNVNAQGITLSGSNVDFYATCASGTTPASCGTWTSSTNKCSSTTSGAEIQFNGSTTLNLAAPTGTNSVLFFFDRCNSNTNAFDINSSGVTAGSGYPSGMLYAHSGEVMINASTSSLPTALVVNSIYYNSGSIVLGTSSGSVALPGAPSGEPMLSN